jgi:hypothetical protein
MSIIELLIGAIVILGGGVAYFKSQSDKNKRDAILGETKGQDKELAAAEKLIQDKIEQVKNQDDSKLTPQERADRWGK